MTKFQKNSSDCVVAVGGGGMNFFTTLLMKAKKNTSDHLYFPLINEYKCNRSYVDNIDHYEKLPICYDDYTKRWRCYTQVDRGICDKRHPEEFDINMKYDNVYYIDTENIMKYILCIGAIKSGYAGNTQYGNASISRILDEDWLKVDIDLYRSFCKSIKKSPTNINPMGRMCIQYFLEYGDKPFDFEHYKQYSGEYVELRIKHNIQEFGHMHTFEFFEDLIKSSKHKYNVIKLDYIDLIEGNTNTIFDMFFEELEEYHDKNVECIKMYDKEFGTDLIRYVPDKLKQEK